MPEQGISREALLIQLSEGLESLGQAAHPQRLEAYLDYIQLLTKWNQSYNLSGIRLPEKMVSHHVLDSLSALPFLHGNDCLDVGSGAGLPGFILALAEPDRHWTLLDSNIKKTRFLNHLLLELKPGNVEVVHHRVEEFSRESGFSTIISRAMSSFSGLQQSISHLIRADTVLIAMKGGLSDQERQSADFAAADTSIRAVQVPGVDTQRNLVIQSKATV